MIILKNENSKILINETAGLITSFETDKIKFLENECSPLFRVALRDKNELTEYVSNSFKFIDSQEKDGVVNVSYNFEDKLCVNVTVQSKVGGFEFNISVQNKTPLLIDYVDYPLLTVYGKLADEENGKGRVLYPFNEGLICSDLYKRLNSNLDFIPPQCPSRLGGGVYPNMVESQFIGYLLDDCGVYMGMHDTTFAPKGIDFYSSKSGMRFLLRYFCGLNYGESLKIGCPVFIKAFDGGWTDCADVYKEWFEQNKPAGLKKLCERDDLPELYEQSPTVILTSIKGKGDKSEMSINKNFPYINMIPKLNAIKEKLGGKIMAFLAHWEGTAPWSAPYVWPPYPDYPTFEVFEKALHEQGDYLGLYCSGLGFTEISHTHKDYNQLELLKDPDILDSLCRMPDGTLADSQSVQFVRKGYDLCAKGKLTKEIMVDQVKQIVNAKVDYVQILDQNHGGNACFCYSDKHGHPVGQGSWQVDTMRDMMQEFCKQKKGVLFGCESAAAEPFIQYLLFSDNRYFINYNGNNSCVPLYAYCYHEYVNNFSGNGSWNGLKPHKYNQTFRMAYSFTAGDMLTLIMDDNGDLALAWSGYGANPEPLPEQVLSMVRQMNDWRKNYKDYLIYGKLAKAWDIKFDAEDIIIQHSNDRKEELLKPLQCGRFVSQNGNSVQFVVNYTENEIEFSLANEKQMQVFTCVNGKPIITVKHTIAPFSIVMISL